MIAIPFFRRTERKLEVDPDIEQAINYERGELRNNAAAIASGSRVLQNMAGAMHMMALAGRIDNDGQN